MKAFMQIDMQQTDKWLLEFHQVWIIRGKTKGIILVFTSRLMMTRDEHPGWRLNLWFSTSCMLAKHENNQTMPHTIVYWWGSSLLRGIDRKAIEILQHHLPSYYSVTENFFVGERKRCIIIIIRTELMRHQMVLWTVAYRLAFKLHPGTLNINFSINTQWKYVLFQIQLI